jgi:excisionase family DNA binding protein
MTPHYESPNRVKRVSLTPAEFAQVTGMKVKAVRVAIHNNEINVTRLGNRLHIPITEVARLFGEAALARLDDDAA